MDGLIPYPATDGQGSRVFCFWQHSKPALSQLQANRLVGRLRHVPYLSVNWNRGVTLVKDVSVGMASSK